MKKFYVDFCGWAEIEAESEEDARDIFWRDISDKTSMTIHDVEIDSIEED